MYALKKVLFIKNAIILTITALILRLAGIIFKVWLAKAIGSEGIGLYQLTLSAYVLFSTFATGGISTAVTRLCADELAIGSGRGAIRILKKGIMLSTIVALFSLAVTYLGADIIAVRLLGDARCAPAIRIFGFSLPFMGISSCLRGYFVARRKTVSSGLSQIFEQAVRIFIVVFLSAAFASRGLAFACAAVFLGDTAAEALSTAFLYLSFLLDRKKALRKQGPRLAGGVKKLISISAPITSGKYLNSVLRTAENITVPKTLALYGNAGLSSLSQFGMIKGMALPLIFFPASFLSSVSLLLIPEMSEALAKNQKYKIKYIAEKVITLTFVSSFFLLGLFFTLSEPLGILIYDSREVGFLLRALSPLIPLMYIDSVCDGMLKGLDKQTFVFRLTVFDSASRIVLIWLFVPSMGMKGFLLVMFISNALTGVWRVIKLIKTAEMPFSLERWVIKPFLFAAVSSVPAALMHKAATGPLLKVIISVLAGAVLYIALAVRGGCIGRDDIRDIIKK